MKRKISVLFSKHKDYKFNKSLKYKYYKKKKIKSLYILEHEYDILGTNFKEKKVLSIITNKRAIKYLKVIYKKLSGFSEFNNACFKYEHITIKGKHKINELKVYLIQRILFENDYIDIWDYQGAYFNKNDIPVIFKSDKYYISEEIIGSLYWTEGFFSS